MVAGVDFRLPSGLKYIKAASSVPATSRKPMTSHSRRTSLCVMQENLAGIRKAAVAAMINDGDSRGVLARKVFRTRSRKFLNTRSSQGIPRVHI